MPNIPNDSSYAQSIVKFHKEMNASFYELGLVDVQAKFSAGTTIQNAFMTEAREDLIPLLRNIDSDECLVIELSIQCETVIDGDYYKAKLSSPVKNNSINQVLSDVLIDIKKSYSDLIPVLFIFKEPKESLSSYLSFGLDLIEKPFSWGEEKEKSVKVKPNKPKEQELEKELLEWLFSYGIQVDNQVITSKHRTDIWIPSKCFIELKRDKVTGDDICQAIEYCVEHKMPIIVVGNNITNMASRGITAFNKAVDVDLICFVQWSAIKVYLKGLLGLR